MTDNTNEFITAEALDAAPMDGETTEYEVPEKEPVSARDSIEAAFDKVAKKETQPAVDAPVEQADAPTAAPEDQPTATVAAKAETPKAPQSWTPSARQKFATLPLDVQQEVAKRETEITRKLGETANERKIAHDFLSVAQPYEAHFKSIGVHPLQAAQELFNAGYTLHTGNQQQKAKLITQFVKNYGIDVKELDAALSNSISPSAAKNVNTPDPELLNRLAKLESTYNSQNQQAQQAQTQQINTMVETFANDPKNEFFNDVSGHMMGLLQAGQAKDLQDAYEQACWANPAVRKVLQDKQSNDAARRNAGGATLRNNGPRASVGLAPVKGKTTRDILEQLVPKDQRY